MLGVPMPDEATLRARLKQAIENSRNKRYHGSDEHMNQLPPLEEQAKNFLEEIVKPFQYYNEEKKEFLPAEAPEWREAIMAKFQWIK